jgi:hypothetical protein
MTYAQCAVSSPPSASGNAEVARLRDTTWPELIEQRDSIRRQRDEALDMLAKMSDERDLYKPVFEAACVLRDDCNGRPGHICCCTDEFDTAVDVARKSGAK